MDKLTVFTSLEQYKSELSNEIKKVMKNKEKDVKLVSSTNTSYDEAINSYRSHIRMIDTLINRL
jgi:hypothetical protein